MCVHLSVLRGGIHPTTIELVVQEQASQRSSLNRKCQWRSLVANEVMGSCRMECSPLPYKLYALFVPICRHNSGQNLKTCENACPVRAARLSKIYAL
jgi:hypothetical protein